VLDAVAELVALLLALADDFERGGVTLLQRGGDADGGAAVGEVLALHELVRERVARLF
jgi:hypothetical protein